MCGIALAYRSSSGAEDWVEAMAQRLSHRGPDDEGFVGANPTSDAVFDAWAGEKTPVEVLKSSLPYTPKSARAGQSFSVVLGHRRLSILDLSPSGHEPICTRDGKLWLSFNGEIYNYVELREELKKSGHEFSSAGDAEVILAAYSQWGKEAFRRFEGMFALGIIDLQKKELVLARDPFGIKPLYWTRVDQGIAAASEAQAFRALPGWKPRVCAQAAYSYLVDALTDHGETCFYEGVYQIPAGAVATIPLRESGQIPAPSIGKYWDVWKLGLSGSGTSGPIPIDRAAEELREIFLSSVRFHLRSDVPVGACLSGGIDSSSIVMAMRKVGGPSLDIDCFGFVAGDPGISEEKWMEIVSRESGARLHRVQLTSGDLKNDIDDLIRVQDFPFGSTSMYAQYRVFRAAKEAGIKVMLDGQGSDEIFAGYFHFLSSRLRTLVGQGNLGEASALARQAIRLPGATKREVWGRTALAMMPAWMNQSARKLAGVSGEPPWLDAKWFLERDVRTDRGSSAETCGDGQYLKHHLKETIDRTSLPQLLRYEDRNSMAHSIESRVPFLITRLVEYVFRLPEEYLIDSNATTKAIFRKAMRGIVPDAILDRKDKIGFRTPESSWLGELGPWVERELEGESCHRVPALLPYEVKKEWKKIQSGQARFDFRVWRWVNLIRWSELNEVDWNS